MANKPHYEGSEATANNHSNFYKDTKHNKYKEASSTIKYSNSLVQNKSFIKQRMPLHFYNKVIQIHIK